MNKVYSNNCHFIDTGKIQGASPSWIRAHDLCDAGAMLYQLIYEAAQVGADQYVDHEPPQIFFLKCPFFYHWGTDWEQCVTLKSNQTLGF